VLPLRCDVSSCCCRGLQGSGCCFIHGAVLSIANQLGSGGPPVAGWALGACGLPLAMKLPLATRQPSRFDPHSLGSRSRNVSNSSSRAGVASLCRRFDLDWATVCLLCHVPVLAAAPHLESVLAPVPCRESPQWRRGPPHKAILCNACGTRYRCDSRAAGSSRTAATQNGSCCQRDFPGI
jgi:hypothetical protein